MALRAFAYTDVLHTVCIPRRRTLFAFTSLPGDPDTPINAPSPINTDETDRAVEIHLGLPVGLLLCIAATSNLSAEAGAFPDEVVAVKAQAIEKTIRDWRPLAPDAAALVDSTAYIDELSTAEMWRHVSCPLPRESAYKTEADPDTTFTDRPPLPLPIGPPPRLPLHDDPLLPPTNPTNRRPRHERAQGRAQCRQLRLGVRYEVGAVVLGGDGGDPAGGSRDVQEGIDGMWTAEGLSG
jgi:hypothetical protein